MTYLKLKTWLNGLSPEQLKMDVTVRIDDEFFAAKAADVTNEEPDVLDPNHPFLIVETNSSIQ